MKKRKLCYVMIPVLLLLIVAAVIFGVWQMSRPTTLHVAQFASGSYSITYYFDEDGHYTITKDTRESQK